MQHIPSSVWGHSSPQGFEAYIIFCVGTDKKNIQAFRRWAKKEHLNYKSLVGCYLGQRESSFITNARNYSHIEHWITSQDSILYLGSCDARDRRPAILCYKDGREDYLGKLVSVSADVAHQQHSWTYDPTQDTYFICQ